MAEIQLHRRSALAGFATTGRYGRQTGEAGIAVRVLSELSAATIIARKGKQNDVVGILSQHLHTTVTDAPGRIAFETLSVVGTAPGQWLVIDRDSASPRLSALSHDARGVSSIVAQSDSRILLEVSGPRARDALVKGVPVDIDPTVFKVGHAAQTSVAYIGVQLALISELPTFEIVTPASSAGSFWHWLMLSAAEFGVDVE